MTPTLSICIPTYNRADLLSDLLQNISQVIEPYLSQIEIVIADNASKDNTAEVVSSCGLPIVYRCQTKTVSFTKNMLFATTEIASGEYIWIIGDDDLILPGAFKQIFESIDSSPKVDYHYLNFGWIEVKSRHQLIHDLKCLPEQETMDKLQFSLRETIILKKLEDLCELPSYNVSAAFSGIFCFVVRRHYFQTRQALLSPSDSMDGSSTNLSDCFPHAMLTVPAIAGKPVCFIGQPCLMQGINNWEWGDYAYKNMILGTFQLFEWMESTDFDKNALAKLWQSYYSMAGRLFVRMQLDPDKHKGKDLVMAQAIRHCSTYQTFWDAFLEESRRQFNAADTKY